MIWNWYKIRIVCLILLASAAATRFVSALTIEEAVQRALDANPAIQASRAERQAAAYEAQSSFREFGPKLMAEASAINQSEYAELSMSMDLAALGIGLPAGSGIDIRQPLADHHLETASLSLVQPLTPLYKIHKGYRLRLLMEELAAADLAAASDRIRVETVKAYCGLLMARNLVELSRSNIDELTAHRSTVESFFKVGHVLKRDLLLVELGLENARLELAVNQRKAELALRYLADVMNVEPDAIGELEAPPEESPAPKELPEAIEASLGRRVELRKARLGVEAEELQLRIARSDYMPDLILFGSHQRQQGNYSLPEENNIVGLKLDAVLFEWGKTRQAVSARRSNIRKAEANHEVARQMIRLDVTAAYHAVRDSMDRLRVARKNFDLADESLRITRKQYDVGRAAITDLLNDQTVLHEARTKSTMARYGLVIAHADWMRATGEWRE